MLLAYSKCSVPTAFSAFEAHLTNFHCIDLQTASQKKDILKHFSEVAARESTTRPGENFVHVIIKLFDNI